MYYNDSSFHFLTQIEGIILDVTESKTQSIGWYNTDIIEKLDGTELKLLSYHVTWSGVQITAKWKLQLKFP